jgi:hypothetical protein
MKGIPISRLKRFKRTALLVGAGMLVAGASLLGATQAHALTVVGTQLGDVSFSPSTGPVTATGITYATTTACPSSNQGSGVIRIIDPASGEFANLAPVSNSVASPFSGTFNGTFALAEQLYPDIVGATAEVAVYCFTGTSATGTSIPVQYTFVQISADGSTYTETNSVSTGPVTTTTTLNAPSTASVGQTITLSATVSPSNAAGTVQFEVGGTAINGPQTVTNGSASTQTSFGAAGTESLSAVFTPTDSTAFTTSTGTATTTVTAAQVLTGTIPLAVSVPASGSFNLTIDTTDTVTLAVTSAGTNATAPTTPIVVSDTRNTYPGWSVTGQDPSGFTGSGSAAGASMSGNQLGWTPTSSTSPLTQGVTLGSPVSPASPGLGTTAATLASAVAGLGNGTGTTTLGANLDLLFPSGQAAGPYTGGLVITGVAVAP